MKEVLLKGLHPDKGPFIAKSDTHYISDSINPAVYEQHWLEAVNKHDIIFEGVTFTGNSGLIASNGLHHITFRDCRFLHLDPSNEIFCLLKPGNDYWTFIGCSFELCGDAIYTKQDNDYGAAYLKVEGCYFKNIGTHPEHPSRDGHAVGYQNPSTQLSKKTLVAADKRDYVIELIDNTCYNTGTALCGWSTVDQPLKDILVTGNYIAGCRNLGNENGSGVKFTGSHPLGPRDNIIVQNNFIDSCDGYGISNNSDYLIKNDNNAISNCVLGNKGISNV